MVENAARLGAKSKQVLSKLPNDIVSTVRGKGLFNAIVIRNTQGTVIVIFATCY